MKVVDTLMVGMGTDKSRQRIAQVAGIAGMVPVDEETWDAITVIPAAYALTISSSNGGTVITPGEGSFDCDIGAVILLEAVPIIGYRFVAWSGAVDTVADVNASETTITMYGDYSITAIFEPEGVALGGIKGHVYDKETGDPISGVNVSFQLYSGQTDPQGYYEISDIPTGTHTFTFVAGGYKVAQRVASIIKDGWNIFDVELTPGEGAEEPNLLWLWILLGVAGTAIVAIRTKHILSEPERPRAGYERISWR